MSLSSLTQYWPPRHTYKSLSNLDAGVTILATSFVSVDRRYVPRICQLSHLLSMLGVSLGFPVLRAPVQAVTCHTSFRNPGASFSTHLPHRTFPLCCHSPRLCHIYWRLDTFHARISPLAFPPSREIPWASNLQNVKVVGGIYQRNGRFTQVL